MKVVMFLGSARDEAPPWGGPARLGSLVCGYASNYFKSKGHQVNVIDPLVMYETFPILKKPHYYYKAGEAPAELERVAKLIDEADAIVVVSGEYNHTIPPALTNMMDHFGSSKYAYKPSGIITYSSGPWGGMRAAIALRPFLSELGCLPVSYICAFANPVADIDGNGVPLVGKEEYCDKKIIPLLTQLTWFAEACSNMKKLKGIPK